MIQRPLISGSSKLEDGKGEALSFFHDVPLHPFPENTSVYNMVVEIPRYHTPKLEVGC